MKQILSDFIRRRTGMLAHRRGIRRGGVDPADVFRRLGGLVQARLDYRSHRGLRRRGFTAG